MKDYAIVAHPTEYHGVLFRSRLEAQWAAFFDLVGWEWEYEPLDLIRWTPDFRVTFPCGHSECNGSHVLLVEIKPYYSIDEFRGHPCMDYPYGNAYPNGLYDAAANIPADASAAFGNNPNITYWEMAHGSGGGIESINRWVDGNISELWKKAGALVQWHPPNTSSSRPPGLAAAPVTGSRPAAAEHRR
jgi:hypothetical protein